MTPKQQYAVNDVPGRHEYDGVRSILPKLIDQFPDLVVSVTNYSNNVEVSPAPRHRSAQLAYAGGRGKNFRFSAVKESDFEKIVALMNKSLELGPM